MIARRLGCLLAAGAMVIGGAGAASAHCASAAEQSAFDVAALKSELSVLAVACQDDNEYNAFVERDRAELVREDGLVNGWFKKSFGRAAQTRYDSYITLQANEQGLAGQHEGSDFCPRLKPVFSEVMAVPVDELPEYAAAKNLMPIDFACVSISETAAAATPAHSRTPAKRTVKK